MTAAALMALVSILSTGSFHGDEVPSGSSGQWFALIDAENPFLRSVHVSVVSERDVILDDGDEKTGKRIELKPAIEPEPLVLLRGIPGLEDGPLPTALNNQQVDVGKPLQAQLGKVSYRLTLRCTATPPVEGQRQETCQLRLHSGSEEGTLATYSTYLQDGQRYWAAEYPPTIVWAGDLDGDERLDILLDTSNHYNVSTMTLYLSSAAKKGQLVGEAARVSHTGC